MLTMDAELLPHSKNVARLLVENVGPEVRLVSAGEPPTHALRWPSHTLVLAQERDPDAPWGATLESAVIPASAPLDVSGASWASAFMAFAAGSGLESHAEALATLPTGAYWLVRCRLQADPRNTVLLGNRYVPAPSGTCGLLGPSALAVSAVCDVLSPGVFRGAVFLDCAGEPGFDAAWIAPHNAISQGGDGSSVLVLPVDGELVACAQWGEGMAAERAASFARWRDRVSAERAEQLARS